MTMKSTFINASAGTGKTYTVATRLADRLSPNDPDCIRPSEVIATTFTEKAATELRRRIRDRLLEEGLLEEAREVSSALIGTVNAISSALVQDFAIDAGLSPELSILDEDGADAAFANSTGEFIAHKEAENTDLLARMGYDEVPTSYGPGGDTGTSTFEKTVHDLVTLSRANGISPDDLRDQIEPSVRETIAILDSLAPKDPSLPDPTAWIAPATDGFRRAREADQAAQKRPSDAFDKRSKAFSRVLGQLADGADRHPWSQWVKYGTEKITLHSASFGKGLSKIIRSSLPDMESTVIAHPRYRQDVRDLTCLVLSTAAEALERYGAYKNAMGFIDFADQEALALDLLDRDDVKATISDRYRILVVDEFQDTSPIQLALFMKIADLTGEVLWVGDPKQSIYRFRGADPDLVDAVRNALEHRGSKLETLNTSWRSHERPLELTSELFTRTLGEDSNAAIRPADAVANERRGGAVEVWQPDVKKAGTLDECASAAARGVVRLLEDERIAPRDIAVLARTNANAARVGKKLALLGIPNTASRPHPAKTREGRVIAAGLAYLTDRGDDKALIELVTLLPAHSAHDTWFEDLSRATASDADPGEVRSRRAALLATWRDDPVLAPIEVLRRGYADLTVPEAVAAIVDALDVRGLIAGWTVPRERTGTLDGILAMARTYLERCEATSTSPSVPGFLVHFPDATPPDVSGAEESVFVGTIHSAKGLEWRVVCILLDGLPRPGDPWGTWVRPAAAIDVDDPLAGRIVRFRPPAPSSSPTTMAAYLDDEQVDRRREGLEETRRLDYVAFTRSRERTVLVLKQKAATTAEIKDVRACAGTDVIITLHREVPDNPFLTITAPGTESPDTDPATIEVTYDGTATDVTEAEESPFRIDPDPMPIDDLRTTTAHGDGDERPAARFAPSAVASAQGTDAFTAVDVIADLGAPLLPHGGADWDLVGDAVHAFLALPLADMPDDRRRSAAERLIGAYGVAGRVSADLLLEAAGRWLDWMGDRFPGAAVRTEVPFTYRADDGSRTRGWMDQLLEPADGGAPILIDHKTYPGDDPVRKVRDEYLGQMSVYARALDAAGAGRPREILVHFPMIGKVVRLTPKD